MPIYDTNMKLRSIPTTRRMCESKVSPIKSDKDLENLRSQAERKVAMICLSAIRDIDLASPDKWVPRLHSVTPVKLIGNLV